MQTTKKAYLYQRFSSEKQRKGSSLDRQTDAQRRWLKKNPDVVVIDTFIDDAMSGWTGKHIEKGSLGRLLAAIEEGAVPSGSLILVEHFSRLSRMSIDETGELIKKIWDAGISIVTVQDGEIYSPDDRNDMVKRMRLIVEIDKAYSDSQWRSKKVKGSYKKREEKAAEGKTPAMRRPFWLNQDGTKNKYHVAIQDMFDLYLSGLGQVSILRELQNRYPDFEPIQRMTHTTVMRWITHDVVRGIWRGHEVYERVISEEQFFEAQKVHKDRLYKNVKADRKWPLSGLFQCGHCGKGLSIQQTRNTFPLLRCSNRQRLGQKRSGCDSPGTFPYVVAHYYFFGIVKRHYQRKISELTRNKINTSELNKLAEELDRLKKQSSEQFEYYQEVSAKNGRVKKLLEIMEKTDEEIEKLETRQKELQRELLELESLPITDEAIEIISDTENFNLTMHKLGIRVIIKNNTVKYEDSPAFEYRGYCRKNRQYVVYNHALDSEQYFPTDGLTPESFLFKDVNWKEIFDTRKERRMLRREEDEKRRKEQREKYTEDELREKLRAKLIEHIKEYKTS